ncbi:hypothetical protein C2I36_15265 [Rhodobacteraceae bacterium WD3A24]|nr:hypothetical protein C2I36_15265 [Rhodobacteraceae bacterium WD3A24]
MQETPPPEAPPPELRFLKLLVTTLAGVMILGLLVVIVLLVIRLRQPAPAPLALPAEIELPDGARVEAFTQSADWYGVVTEGGEIFIFDRATGALRQRVQVE